MTRGAVRRFAAQEKGETMVSFALTFPILVGVMFGLIQMCLAYYNYERISELAREATRYAMFHGSACKLTAGGSCTATAAQIEASVAASGMPALGGGTTKVVASFPDGVQDPGHPVRVVVTCTYPYKIPFLATNGITMSSTSQMYILQ